MFSKDLNRYVTMEPPGIDPFDTVIKKSVPREDFKNVGVLQFDD